MPQFYVMDYLLLNLDKDSNIVAGNTFYDINLICFKQCSDSTQI